MRTPSYGTKLWYHEIAAYSTPDFPIKGMQEWNSTSKSLVHLLGPPCDWRLAVLNRFGLAENMAVIDLAIKRGYHPYIANNGYLVFTREALHDD